MGVDAQMYVRHKGKLSPSEVRALAVKVADAYGPKEFWIFKDGSSGHHALSLVTGTEEYSEIPMDPGYQFIEAHPATRYYGEGYERGDAPFLASLGEWLEFNIPGAEVFYKGDSSEEWERFGRKERRQMMEHFYSVGGSPYFGGFGSIGGNEAVASCDFCECAIRTNGCSGSDSLGYCPGCGDRWKVKPDGTKVARKEGEF